jgi:polysaccharide export outer membrane protein
MRKLQLTAAICVAVALSALACRADDQLQQRERYVLHAGDVLALNYRYTPEYNQTVTIEPDGYVTLDMVGDIKLAGLTVDEARNEVVTRASSRLNHPELDLILKGFEHPYFVVAGEVEKPGKYELREDTTALQAIMLAGGFKDSAKDTRVLLFRKINEDTAEVRRLDLHNIHKTSQLEHDAVLEPGDMLLVTRNKLEHVSRFLKAANLGVYFNPTPIP